MLCIPVLCLARACWWQPVPALIFRTFFRNMSYITRKLARSDGASDEAQVTCACWGENSPFFWVRAFLMSSFVLLLLAGISCRVLPVSWILWWWCPSALGRWWSCWPCLGLGAVQRSVTVTSGSSQESEGVAGADPESPGHQDTYRQKVALLTGKPFRDDILFFLLVCLLPIWRQHYTVIEAGDKRPAICVW